MHVLADLQVAEAARRRDVEAEREEKLKAMEDARQTLLEMAAEKERTDALRAKLETMQLQMQSSIGSSSIHGKHGALGDGYKELFETLETKVDEMHSRLESRLESKLESRLKRIEQLLADQAASRSADSTQLTSKGAAPAAPPASATRRRTGCDGASHSRNAAARELAV